MKRKIISIDGGGIRGLIPARILMRLEEELGSPLNTYFDLAAGTSTGGIIAAAISAGKSMREIVDLYTQEGPYIFKKSWHRGLINPKFPNKQIDDPLNDYFSSMKLADLSIDFLTTAWNITDGRPRFFSKDEGYILVKDALRATTAAPTYFEPAQIDGKEYADGGLFANSPSMCAYAEAKSLYKVEASDLFVLSLGTSGEAKGFDNARKWHKFKWIKPLIDSLLGSDAGVTHYQLMQIYKSVGESDNYIRINGRLPKNVNPQMDDASPNNIKALLDFADLLYEKNSKKIKKIIQKIT